MSSVTAAQLKEEREARTQQRKRDGVLSRMSSPDQQKMGDASAERRGKPKPPPEAGWGTPEHIRELKAGKDALAEAAPEGIVPGSPEDEKQWQQETLAAREALDEHQWQQETLAAREALAKHLESADSGPSELKATTSKEREELEKKYGSWEAAKRAIKAEGDRYRDSLQSPNAWKRDIDASRMAERGDVGDVVGAEDSPFADTYDATTEFQEAEYGGGSLERESLLAEILGQEYRTEPDPKGVEGTITDPDLYEKYLLEAQKASPGAQKEELQDAAIKGVMAEQAERAASAAKRFPKPLDVEATETVGGGLGYEKTIEEIRKDDAAREAAKKKEADLVKGALKNGKFKTSEGGGDTPIQEAARRYVESSYGPDKKASESKLARMQETADARKRNLPVDGRASEPSAPPGEGSEEPATGEEVTTLGRVLSLQKGDPEAFRRAQGTPGMEDIMPALSALNTGNLSGFNKAFGKRETAGFLEDEWSGVFRKQDYRAEGISALPEGVRKSLGRELSKTIAKEENREVEAIADLIDAQLIRQTGATYTEAGGHISPEHTAIIKEKALEIAELIVRTSDISGSPRLFGQEGLELPLLSTKFGYDLYKTPGVRRALEEASIITSETSDSQLQAVLRRLLDTIPEERRQSILDLREGERTLSMLEKEHSPLQPLIAASEGESP